MLKVCSYSYQTVSTTVPCEFCPPEDFLKCQCNQLDTLVTRVAYISSPRTSVKSASCKLARRLCKDLNAGNKTFRMRKGKSAMFSVQ